GTERHDPRETTVTSNDVNSNQGQTPATAELDLEVVTLPVADVDRAKRFYQGLGWRLDADRAIGDEFRLVQFTSPQSPCSIHFGIGLTAAAPGAAERLI